MVEGSIISIIVRSLQWVKTVKAISTSSHEFCVTLIFNVSLHFWCKTRHTIQHWNHFLVCGSKDTDMPDMEVLPNKNHCLMLWQTLTLYSPMNVGVNVPHATLKVIKKCPPQNTPEEQQSRQTTVTELLPDVSQVLKESRPLIHVLCTSVFCKVCSLFWLWLWTVQRLLYIMQLLCKVIKVIDYDKNCNSFSYTNLFLQFCCNKMSAKSRRDGFCANFTSTTLTEAQLSPDSIRFSFIRYRNHLFPYRGTALFSGVIWLCSQ